MRTTAWLCLLVVACSKGGERPAAQSQSADTGMANRPGMTGTTEVTLTAAQVTHGGVHWEPIATSTVASIATVPGQVIPNEDRTARLGATVRGRVIAVQVRPGDRVSAGRLLVTLQSPEAGMAQSDVTKPALKRATHAVLASERSGSSPSRRFPSRTTIAPSPMMSWQARSCEGQRVLPTRSGQRRRLAVKLRFARR